MIFDQGEYIWMDFDPTVGHEPQKMRPALVMSVGYFNNVLSSLVMVCPITSTVNGHPLHVELPADAPVQGCVCVEGLRAVDLNSPYRHCRKVGQSIDKRTMARILDLVGGTFGI